MQTHEWLTHNPQSIKLQALIEVLDFLKPPLGRVVTEEVRERGVGSVPLSGVQENSQVREGSVSLTNTHTCTGDLIGAAGSVGYWIEQPYLHLGIPVQRFIHRDIWAIRPHLQIRTQSMACNESHCTPCFSLSVSVPPCLVSYLAPDNAVTQLLGPLDEDILFQSTVKSGVRLCFIACDGWILESILVSLLPPCSPI